MDEPVSPTDGASARQLVAKPDESLPERDGWPSVTVVVRTHNRPQLLLRTLGSIMDQRYPGLVEALVVFDREEPFRPEVAVPEGRELRVMRNDRTPGPAGGYNAGSLAARGDYVAICDDDDVWLPDKLRLQIEALRAHPRSAVAICGIYVESGRAVARVPGSEVLTLDDLLLASRNEVHTSTFVYRRSAFMDEIGFVDEQIPHSYGEDYDWLVRAARLAPLVAVTQPLVRVTFKYSYFADRWQVIIDALTYQLDRIPELSRQPRNLARIYGRLAFAHAAMGHRQEARSWARRSLRADWREPRGYFALLVSYRILPARAVVRLAHAAGRGM